MNTTIAGTSGSRFVNRILGVVLDVFTADGVFARFRRMAFIGDGLAIKDQNA
jgi:hypothetical protein